MLFECARLILRWWLVKVIECFVRITASLPLIVVVERLRVYKQRDHYMAKTALYQIIQCDAVGRCWLRHIPKFILQIVHLVLSLDSLLQFCDHLSKEHIDDKSVDCALVVDIQHAPEVLQGLGRLFILHREHEVQKGFVVHFAFKCLKLFKNSVNENLRKTGSVPCQLGLFEHAILVGVQLEVLVINAQTAVDAEPVRDLVLVGHALLAQLIELC